MSINNIRTLSRYTVAIVDRRTYNYVCYTSTQQEALEAASAAHLEAREGLACATTATVKGPCHSSECTLGENCTMTIDRVKTEDLN